MLVTNLSMRDGKPVRGSSAAAIPAGNYAIQQMGKVTGAYEAVFNDDIEMFRPANIKQFDAICFNNTLGVLFEDPELRASLLGFVESGKGFVGIHDAIATFVHTRNTTNGPSSAGCLVAPRTAATRGTAK